MLTDIQAFILAIAMVVGIPLLEVWWCERWNRHEED